MIIKNASVYTEDGKFIKKDIYMKDAYFAENSIEDDDVIDAKGCYAIPGLTDIHFHGCMGRDFCEGTQEAIDEMAAYEASVGVTTIVPATMTMGEEVLFPICEAAAAYRLMQQKKLTKKRAILCGINMEGPFISKEKMGAQNPEYIRTADEIFFNNMQQKSGGMIKLVTIAPEAENALSFIRNQKEMVVCSIGHTAADYETARKAFEAGASHVTHLYNAMSAFSHREPGVIGAAADMGARAELICDNVHVHPSAVRAAFKLFGEENIVFISDSMMATGLDDGDYSLGGQAVKVVGNKAVLKDGTIAGSVTNLMDCLRMAVNEMDIPLELAVKCAAVNSAKAAGIYDRYGSITPGKAANLVLLERGDLRIRQIFLMGEAL